MYIFKEPVEKINSILMDVENRVRENNPDTDWPAVKSDLEQLWLDLTALRFAIFELAEHDGIELTLPQ